MARPVLILFARAPRLGLVKRRLAAGIGAVPALRFYRNALSASLRKFLHLPGCDTVIAITPDRSKIRAPGWAVIGQGQGDLGTRMHNAFRCFSSRLVVLVGVDIPGLKATDIAAAIIALRSADAVFGPAADGGYYLVGMGRRRPAKPFAAIRWSSEHALADTLNNFSGLRVRHLRVLRDIDTADDLLKINVP
jgi:rSAM/selenodomain-associated transferase 1